MTEMLSELAGAVGIDRFEQPWWALLALPAAAAWIVAATTRPASLGWSALAQIRRAGARRFDFVAIVSGLLRAS